jgi:hypothetical protein
MNMGKNSELKENIVNETPEEEPRGRRDEPDRGRRDRETDRSERIPFGAPQQRLQAATREAGYHYRVFNDNWRREPGRIQRAMQAGYEVVQDWDRIPVGTNEDGSAVKGVLMRIPQELYDQDQAEKQKAIDKVDQAIKAGKIEEKPGDNRYTPEGIKVWSSNNEQR